MQSRTGSLIEATLNVAVGFLVALAAQLAIYPLFGIRIEMGSNVAIAALFTAISLVRSYVLRRLFNSLGRQIQ